eukprot:4563438-Amphidinium_carterae.1
MLAPELLGTKSCDGPEYAWPTMREARYTHSMTRIQPNEPRSSDVIRHVQNRGSGWALECSPKQVKEQNMQLP